MKTPLVIFGSSGHAGVIVDIAKSSDTHTIIGYIDRPSQSGPLNSDYPVLGDDDVLPELLKKYPKLEGVIAIGDNGIRKKVYDRVVQLCPEFPFATLIHSSAILGSRVKLGSGTVVMPGAVLNCFVQVGEHAIVNSSATMEHECTAGNFSSIGPGVTIGGNSHVGHSSAIGIGSTLLHGIQVGNNAVIGAGSMVNKSLEDNVVAYGVPAKIIRSRSESDAYL